MSIEAQQLQTWIGAEVLDGSGAREAHVARESADDRARQARAEAGLPGW